MSAEADRLWHDLIAALPRYDVSMDGEEYASGDGAWVKHEHLAALVEDVRCLREYGLTFAELKARIDDVLAGNGIPRDRFLVRIRAMLELLPNDSSTPLSPEREPHA